MRHNLASETEKVDLNRIDMPKIAFLIFITIWPQSSYPESIESRKKNKIFQNGYLWGTWAEFYDTCEHVPRGKI